MKAGLSIAACVLDGSRRSEARAQADSHERQRIARGKKRNADPTHRHDGTMRTQPVSTVMVCREGESYLASLPSAFTSVQQHLSTLFFARGQYSFSRKPLLSILGKVRG